MSRYEGKPLLRILECYILSAIGELQSADRENLEALAPKLREVYGVQGDWHEVIAQVMQFPPNMDDELRDLWQRNQQLAAANKESLSAEDFAQMIVDATFGDSGE